MFPNIGHPPSRKNGHHRPLLSDTSTWSRQSKKRLTLCQKPNLKFGSLRPLRDLCSSSRHRASRVSFHSSFIHSYLSDSFFQLQRQQNTQTTVPRTLLCGKQESCHSPLMTKARFLHLILPVARLSSANVVPLLLKLPKILFPRFLWLYRPPSD
jgi:hypothetical protein